MFKNPSPVLFSGLSQFIASYNYTTVAHLHAFQHFENVHFTQNAFLLTPAERVAFCSSSSHSSYSSLRCCVCRQEEPTLLHRLVAALQTLEELVGKNVLAWLDESNVDGAGRQSSGPGMIQARQHRGTVHIPT